MSSTNILLPVFTSFKTTEKCIKTTRLIIKIEDAYPKLKAKLSPLELNSTIEQLKQNTKEIEDLFVLNLWATFERWLRDYLLDKGNILNDADSLGSQLYNHFAKEVEHWKPGEMLDIIKYSTDSVEKKQWIGEAKNILKYRNWIAHGKNPKRLPPSNISADTAYDVLSKVITILDPN